jgi:hypothetical protein
MKQLFAPALLTLLFLGAAPAAEPPHSPDEQVLAVIAEIRAQQVLMTETQTKIDAKLATVTEAMRLARIYASRGGAGK